MAKLLIHICCAPCLIYPFKIIREHNFEVKGFFYNPNIHPENEFNLRWKSLEEYSKKINLDVIKQSYNPDEFFNCISPNKKERCQFCWQMRLEKTAFFAKENNFDYFTTSLLVSPHQNHNKLKQISQAVALKFGVKLFYYDFREGFMGSRITAKENNLYLQKYCGCNYSIAERKERKNETVKL